MLNFMAITGGVVLAVVAIIIVFTAIESFPEVCAFLFNVFLVVCMGVFVYRCLS